MNSTRPIRSPHLPEERKTHLSASNTSCLQSCRRATFGSATRVTATLVICPTQRREQVLRGDRADFRPAVLLIDRGRSPSCAAAARVVSKRGGSRGCSSGCPASSCCGTRSGSNARCSYNRRRGRHGARPKPPPSDPSHYPLDRFRTNPRTIPRRCRAYHTSPKRSV